MTRTYWYQTQQRTGAEAEQEVRHVSRNSEPHQPGGLGLRRRPPLRAGRAAQLVVCHS